MRAVILAGGKGVRLRPYTTTLPKPLMPVGERPILNIVIDQLRAASVERVTIAVNHMAEIIMAFFGSGEKFGLDIDYSIEDKPLGTIAPIRLIKDLPEHFIVMNGDTLTDIDYAALYRSHIDSGKLLTIATYRRQVNIDFGVLTVDEASNLVSGFKEKPTHHFEVSTGIYVFSRQLLERVPLNEPYGLDDLVLGMLKDGQQIHPYRFDGYWLDIGRPEDYDQANRDVERLSFVREDPA
jgi:NDP-sugar pyrophosphorylase family protein